MQKNSVRAINKVNMTHIVANYVAMVTPNQVEGHLYTDTHTHTHTHTLQENKWLLQSTLSSKHKFESFLIYAYHKPLLSEGAETSFKWTFFSQV